MNWVDQYVGIPHAEGGTAPPAWDCYACVRYVLALHAKIFLPPDSAQIDRSQWHKVEGMPQVFDIAEMRAHIGLFVRPARVLHCEKGSGTVCVAPDRLRLPIRGVWRHQSLL